MATIDISRAKEEFDEIARRAEAGETTVITRDDRPTLVVSPVASKYYPRPKRFGLLRGKIWLAPDFNHTSQEMIRDWEGGDDDPA
jgi:antitoxin (DNA-binding transcriptional repressor) of toxin-antitoxin stability system